VDLVGVFRYADTYPESIGLILQAMRSAEGPDFSKLITHRFPGLQHAEEAFEVAGRTKDAEGQLVIKVVIENTVD
jgi:L-iditol 2-dehydrogenase